jgi:hypothetical protein
MLRSKRQDLQRLQRMQVACAPARVVSHIDSKAVLQSLQTLPLRDWSKGAKDMLWTGLTGARVHQRRLPQRVQAATQRYVCILASERVL